MIRFKFRHRDQFIRTRDQRPEDRTLPPLIALRNFDE